MPYRLFDNSQYDADTVQTMSEVFDEVCIELGLANREDRLRDLIACEILDCVSKGTRDPAHIRGCVRNALLMPPPKTSLD
jgi:hypothetical protein